MLLLTFLAKHVAVLLLILAAAAGAGTLLAGGREPLALRGALGLALWGEALFALAAVGWLRATPVVVLVIVAVAGGVLKTRPRERVDKAWTLAFIAIGAPAFLLALQPPLAFDETLYHLPIVRSLARTGGLRFLAELRFPAFPQLQELLCAPVFLMAGDVAPHLVSLVEVMLIAALLAAWARRHTERAAPLAAALFIGSPIVVHLATILYVDMALTLFVTAGFYSLDLALQDPAESHRRPLLFAGLFFGAACSVKYLGGFFALAALVIVIVVRRRAAPVFALATAAAALPATIWILLTTGNPLFPFLPGVFGRSDWTMPPLAAPRSRLMDSLRVVWDVTFARHRMNQQPPVTPLLAVLVLLVAAAALRHWRARAVLLLSAAFLAVFAFLPRDTRYLMPLLPLFCLSAAVIVARRWPRITALAALVAVAPGVAYLVWRLAVAGMPPADARSRHAVIAKRIAGYEALTRAGTSSVYVCGGEQLQYYAGGPFLGDFWGLHSYARVLDAAPGTAALASRLRELDVTYFLVVKARCAWRPATVGLALAYEDEGAQLWRVDR
jgi:4-amino-4-deoxy-L-arabinose transferase-like glycosyltransferase